MFLDSVIMRSVASRNTFVFSKNFVRGLSGASPFTNLFKTFSEFSWGNNHINTKVGTWGKPPSRYKPVSSVPFESESQELDSVNRVEQTTQVTLMHRNV